jgi:hypothetical membrane protein
MTDYHAIFFTAAFLLWLLLTVVFILPLAILQVIKVFKPAVRISQNPLFSIFDLQSILIALISIFNEGHRW